MLPDQGEVVRVEPPPAAAAEAGQAAAAAAATYHVQGSFGGLPVALEGFATQAKANWALGVLRAKAAQEQGQPDWAAELELGPDWQAYIVSSGWEELLADLKPEGLAAVKQENGPQESAPSGAMGGEEEPRHEAAALLLHLQQPQQQQEGPASAAEGSEGPPASGAQGRSPAAAEGASLGAAAAAAAAAAGAGSASYTGVYADGPSGLWFTSRLRLSVDSSGRPTLDAKSQPHVLLYRSGAPEAAVARDLGVLWKERHGIATKQVAFNMPAARYYGDAELLARLGAAVTLKELQGLLRDLHADGTLRRLAADVAPAPSAGAAAVAAAPRQRAGQRAQQAQRGGAPPSPAVATAAATAAAGAEPGPGGGGGAGPQPSTQGAGPVSAQAAAAWELGVLWRELREGKVGPGSSVYARYQHDPELVLRLQAAESLDALFALMLELHQEGAIRSPPVAAPSPSAPGAVAGPLAAAAAAGTDAGGELVAGVPGEGAAGQRAKRTTEGDAAGDGEGELPHQGSSKQRRLEAPLLQQAPLELPLQQARQPGEQAPAKEAEPAGAWAQGSSSLTSAPLEAAGAAAPATPAKLPSSTAAGTAAAAAATAPGPALPPELLVELAGCCSGPDAAAAGLSGALLGSFLVTFSGRFTFTQKQEAAAFVEVLLKHQQLEALKAYLEGMVQLHAAA